MRKFQTLKLSQFNQGQLVLTKQQLVGLKTGGLVGLCASFEGSFFNDLGVKKILKLKRYIS